MAKEGGLPYVQILVWLMHRILTEMIENVIYDYVETIEIMRKIILSKIITLSRPI